MTNEKTSRLGYDATYLFCSLNSFWHIFRLAVCRFVWSIKMKNKFDGEKIILFLSIRFHLIHTHLHLFSTCYPRCMHLQGDRDLSQSRSTKTQYVRVCVCVEEHTLYNWPWDGMWKKNDVRTRTAFTLANGQFVCVAHMFYVSQNAENRFKSANSHLILRLCEPIEWVNALG